MISVGSRPSRAASTSPRSSRSSGSMYARSRKAYAAASSGKVRRSAASPSSAWPSSSMRTNPFSDRLQPRSRAMPRRRMLWSAEPVKWTRYVPASPGGMTIRSTLGPRSSLTAALACPAPSTRSTTPRPAKRLTTASGSSVSTRRSRSPMVSRRRRSEPAWTIRVTPAVPSSWATRSSEIACARLSSNRCGRDSSWAMPSRIRCSVLAEMPLRLAQAARLGRLAQVLQRRDAQALVDDAHGLGPDARDPQQVDEARRDLGPQPLVDGHVPGRRELDDLVADRLAHARDRPAVARGVRRRDVERGPGDGVGGPVVGDGLEHDLALDLEDVADLVEDPREVAVGRRAPAGLGQVGVVGVEGVEGVDGVAVDGLVVGLEGHASMVRAAPPARRRRRADDGPCATG